MTQLVFNYRAIDQRGDRTKGTLRADDQNDAYRKIAAAGMKPIRIAVAGKKWFRGKKKVSIKELSHFTYQFSVLMQARIPIADGLRSIGEQESNPTLRDILEDIARKIESGCTVTESINPHREVFGEVYVETIRAAEVSGNMTKVLAHLSEMMERQYETSKNVKGAIMYPLCVVIALGLAVTFLMIFVIPKFATMFESRGLELPLPTLALMAFSEFIRTYWYLLIGGAIGGFVSIRTAWRKPKSRSKIDTALHRLPFLRDVLRGLAVSRFAHVLGTSLQSGLGLIDALEMSGRASGRPLLQADVQKMRDQVNHGRRLSEVLLACTYLPAFSRRMIAAGEEAAELPRMCDIVARHYDREVAHLTKDVATIVEPLLIAGLAGIVLVIALAIFLPMWDMAALIG